MVVVLSGNEFDTVRKGPKVCKDKYTTGGDVAPVGEEKGDISATWPRVTLSEL